MVAVAPQVSETPFIRCTRWALAFTVAAMPLYVAHYQVGPIPTTLLENLILVTIGLYVVACIQAGVWRPVRTSLEIPIVLLLIAGLIGITVAPDHRGALGIYRAYFIEPVLLFYISLDLMRTPEGMRMVLGALAIGTTLFAVMNLGAWVVAVREHQVISTANPPEFLQTSPNAVAMFLEPAVAIAAGFVLYADRSRDRNLALVCLVFLLPAMVLTLSRAAMLTMIALVLVAVATVAQRRLKIALLGGALIGGIAIARIPWVQERLAHQLDFNNPSNTLEGRLRIWSDTLAMLRDHPIFGAGLRAYTQVMARYVTGGRIAELFPHDIWLALWSELGLLGLAAFAVLMGLLLWWGFRAFARATGFYRPLLWGTSAAFVTIAVHGLFDTPYFKNDFSVEFWIVAALEIAAIRGVAARATGNGAAPRLIVSK